MQPMANIALRAAREAAKKITRAFDRPDLIKVDEKAHNDFVTNVDRDAEWTIVQMLQETFPEHSITGEESINNKVVEGAEYEWIIDPIDGTANFLRQIPHFCISIACLHKGKHEHAVILDPIRLEEFVASRGHGCQLNDKRVRISGRKNLDGAVLATDGRYHEQAALAQSALREQLTEQQARVRQFGSACLDLAYLAAGRIDGLWMSDLRPWDMAAGALMVTEAGGLIGDFKGGSNFMETGQIVAASPKIFKSLAPMVKKHHGVTRH